MAKYKKTTAPDCSKCIDYDLCNGGNAPKDKWPTECYLFILPEDNIPKEDNDSAQQE